MWLPMQIRCDQKPRLLDLDAHADTYIYSMIIKKKYQCNPTTTEFNCTYRYSVIRNTVSVPHWHLGLAEHTDKAWSWKRPMHLQWYCNYQRIQRQCDPQHYQCYHCHWIWPNIQILCERKHRLLDLAARTVINNADAPPLPLDWAAHVNTTWS